MGLAEMVAAQSQWGATQQAFQPAAVAQLRAYQPDAMRRIDPLTRMSRLTPMPGAFDRVQPVNPLEQQLAMRRMLESRGNGLQGGTGYDRGAAPVTVPTPMSTSRQNRYGMPTPERGTVHASTYGGR
jgi:hypothetical protein